jgi:hypothetical protein
MLQKLIASYWVGSAEKVHNLCNQRGALVT